MKNIIMSWLKTILSLFFCICLAVHFMFANSDPKEKQTLQTPNYKKIEVPYTSDDIFVQIAQLGIGVDCGVEVSRHSGKQKITLEVSDREYNAMLKKGLNPSILIDDLSSFYTNRNLKGLPAAKQKLAGKKVASMANKRTAQDMGCVEDSYPVPQNFNLGSMGGFTTYQELLNDLDKMANLYPNLITQKTPVSSSGQTTHQGRPLYYVKVSDNPNASENEPEVLYTGLHHAREPLSMINLQYYLWYLLENYNTDPTVKNIVDNTELYFIPVVNPDGYVYNESTNPNGGGLWRKNRRNNGNGTYGVDLNRNYSYKWGYNDTGSSPNTNSDTYRGPSAFSEPETQIMKAFAESHNFINVFNNHSYGNLLLHAWGYTTNPSQDQEVLGEISEHMCWHNRYNYGGAFETINYTANGDASDWFYGEQSTKNKSFVWTPEIGGLGEGGFWPSPSLIVDLCERQLRMSLILAESATNHGVLNDITPYSLKSTTPTLSFNVQHMSLTPGSFTITVSSSDPNVVSIPNPVINTANLTDSNNETVSTMVNLAPGIAAGTPISFNVVLNNGTYNLYSTTITKAYNPIEILYDDCDDMSNWSSSTGWGVDNSTGFKANGSLTDSPFGNSSNGSRTITLTSPIDLSGTQNPVLEFYTKWDIFRLFSFAQLEISTNGSVWSEVCGNYTKPGVSTLDSNPNVPDQPANEALYDGYQNTFVREEIDLSSYAGANSVYFRFTFSGDSDISQEAGFWFDDFTIYREPLGHCENAIQDADETDVDCGGVDCLACPTCFDGIQNGNETGVDCGGSECVFCPPCSIYDFNTYPLLNFDVDRDFGSLQVQDGGATVFMTDYVWKAIDISYAVTPQTLLTFDFKSTVESEIHEIAFDNDLIFAPIQRAVIYGNQGFGGTLNNAAYNGSGNWQSFTINIGAQFTGSFQYLVLAIGNNANTAGNSYFRNIKIFEDTDGDLACDVQCVAGDVCNDNDPCTIGETYDNNCNCTSSVLLDADNDGVCDTNDQCPGTNDSIIGTNCNDNDPCTISDVYDTSCNCSGTFADSDNDGVCNANDQCPGGDDNLDINMDGIPDACYVCSNIIVELNNSTILHDREANVSISTNGKVPNGANVQYYAGDEVEMMIDFEVELNADFEAYIAPCN